MDGETETHDDARGANYFNDVKGPFFKLGIDGRADTTMVVYYDEVRIGAEDATYADVAP